MGNRYTRMKGLTDMETRFVACAYDVTGRVTEGRCYCQTFATAAACRGAVRHSSPSVSVIVFDHTVDVSPINLAAALTADGPDRDIYLLVEEMSGSLSSRAHAAGIRKPINHEQALEMLGSALRLPQTSENTDSRSLREQSEYIRRHGSSQPFEPAVSNHAAQGAIGMQTFDLDFDEMIDELEESSRPTLGISQVSQRDLKLHAFISGRGGVGKSTVTLLLAMMAQRRDMRVVLLDLDLQFGDLCFMIEKAHRQHVVSSGLEELIKAKRLPDLQAGTILLASAPSQPERAESIAAQIPEFVHRLNDKADIILANTGTVWTEIQAVLAQYSRSLIFMMDQRATSIQGCKQAMEFCIRMKVPSTRFAFLLNRCGKGSPITAQDASLALAGADVWTLADGGALVDELLALGAPEELLADQSPLVDSLDELLDTILGQGSPFINTKREKAAGKIPGLPDLSGLRRFLSGENHVAP